MSRKSRGINAERELIHLFWANEWAACRIAGSGSTRYPSADVLASNSVRKIAIEAKLTKDKAKYFTSDEIEQLKEFSRLFGAEPWIGLRFLGQKWKFLSLTDIQKTKNHYVITQEWAAEKGKSFEELVE